MKVTLHSAFDHNAFTTFACQRTYKLNDWLIAECPHAASRRPGRSRNTTTLVRDSNGQQLAYVYFEVEPGRRCDQAAHQGRGAAECGEYCSKLPAPLHS